MYTAYSDFTVWFPNVDITEDEFSSFEEVAESLAFRYIGETPSQVYPDLQYAIGLIVQNLVAQGRKSIDLPKSENEGGVSKQYEEQGLIPPKAIEILDKFKGLYV